MTYPVAVGNSTFWIHQCILVPAKGQLLAVVAMQGLEFQRSAHWEQFEHDLADSLAVAGIIGRVAQASTSISELSCILLDYGALG